jgi:hypothetical protein
MSAIRPLSQAKRTMTRAAQSSRCSARPRSSLKVPHGAAMSAISILPGKTHWRSRKVRYYAGNWDSIQAILPEFDLVPFTAGLDEPANPFLQTVMRRPLSATERPIPVGVVSHAYSLAPHREVAVLCRNGLLKTGIDSTNLRYEVGLSELGEWMNFRIYFPESYSFIDAHRGKLDLRLECFNSVDGSSRLVILFGWYRLICANGLVIGETKIEIKERHGQSLELPLIPDRIRPALDAVEAQYLKEYAKRADMKKVDLELVVRAAARIERLAKIRYGSMAFHPPT